MRLLEGYVVSSAASETFCTTQHNMSLDSQVAALLKQASPEDLIALVNKAKASTLSAISSSSRKKLGIPGKYVYYFSPSGTEGSVEMKNELGGKGANLAEMASIGLPVPPGFTISAEMCDVYTSMGGDYPQSVKEEVAANLARLEVCSVPSYLVPVNCSQLVSPLDGTVLEISPVG